MAHQWRPRPIQGNICPTCSISHFPFCPPSAPINLNPNSTPQMHLQRPIYPNPDPYSSSGYWNPNPNPSLERENYGTQYQLHQLNYDYGAANGHVGESEFGVNDRSSKRLRVDGYSDSSRVLSDVDERRLKLVRDHGRTMDGQGPSSGFGFTGGMRGHDHENVVVDGNVGAGMRGYDRENAVVDGNIGVEMRPPSNLETNSFRDHQHPGYGKLSNPLNPGAFHHGWDYKQTTYGASEVSRDSFGTNPAFPGHSTPYYEQRSNTQQSDWTKYDYYDPSYQKGVGHRSEVRATLAPGGYPGPTYGQNFPRQRQFGHPDVNRPEGYGNLENMGQLNVSQGFDIRPPLPPSPPPPFPSDPSGHWSAPPKQLSSLFPVSVSSSAASHSSYNDYCPVPEPRPLHNSQIVHSSSNMFAGESPATKMASRHHYGEGQPFPSKNYISDKPKIVDASHLFKPSHRASRPDHFVIILRGLPGSGKSYIAKMLRDLEVEHGGDAPRIHSMDDYFMTEVEKVEENESSKSSVRGKKPTAKKVLLYCYEPEMEEAYRSSMLKSFKKTLEEGVYTFVIVDDRNLRIADFAQFWATAKRSGYEVYLLEAPYKDPAGCTARNVHGFTQGDVEKMARQWEDAPSLYLQLDVKSLFHGDDLKESSILEVDMDMEDGDSDGGLSKLEEANHETVVSPSAEGTGHDNSLKDEKRWDEETEEVKDLGHSKWSGDLDEDDRGKPERVRGSADVLSRLFTTYGKEGKSVHWGDQVSNTGFSIGAVKKANFASLLIGPGAGYNLKSNPLSEEETGGSAQKPSETKRHSVFQEQLRAERESFRAVFDRRRHRIGLDNADEE